MIRFADRNSRAAEKLGQTENERELCRFLSVFWINRVARPEWPWSPEINDIGAIFSGEIALGRRVRSRILLHKPALRCTMTE